MPPAHLLITIPPTTDRLVLRRLDLEKALSHPQSLKCLDMIVADEWDPVPLSH
jgi:hypothetical protein